MFRKYCKACSLLNGLYHRSFASEDGKEVWFTQPNDCEMVILYSRLRISLS